MPGYDNGLPRLHLILRLMETHGNEYSTKRHMCNPPVCSFMPAGCLKILICSDESDFFSESYFLTAAISHITSQCPKALLMFNLR